MPDVCTGAGIAQWLERRFESLQERRENFLLRGQLSALTLIWVSIPTPCNRSQPFCQKCRWQFTAKHACTLCMWLCMKWHGAWLYGVHRTQGVGSSFMWHQPCQHCKYTNLVNIQKRTIKASHSCRITCEHSASAQEQRIVLYKSNQNQEFYHLLKQNRMFPLSQ